MNLIDLVCICASVLFIFTTQLVDTSAISRSQLKREIRFTKFNTKIPDKTIGTVVECGIRMLRNKQMLFLHSNIHEKLTQLDATFSVSKCKQYYIDCVNVVSYNVIDVCTKLNVFSIFATIENANKQLEKCPIHGEYNYNNMTIDVDKFGPMFSFPLEKWWEFYWKFNIRLYNADKIEIVSVDIEFYYLEFRVRNHRKYDQERF